MKKDKLVSEMLGEEAALTPSDIYSVEFKSAVIGGYDKEEVDAFLERVADVLEALGTKLRETRERSEVLREELTTLKEMEAALRNALTSSQKFSENMVATARQEAEAIIAEARAAHRQAQLAQREYPDALRAEIAALEAARDRLRRDLRAVLQTHAALIDEIEQPSGLGALAPLPPAASMMGPGTPEDEAIVSAFGPSAESAPAWAVDDVEQAEAAQWDEEHAEDGEKPAREARPEER